MNSAFSSLSAEELELRATLEHQVTSSFHTSGMALAKLNELRLYRNTHSNFEEFCLDVFGYSSDYAYLKMAAARIYQNLSDNLPTNGRHFPLPTRQRQLRPIVKAKLDKDAQLEVWLDAIALAEGKIPSYAIVAEAVRLYLAKDSDRENPFVEREVCRIVVKGNSKLKGKGDCWCIVSQVLANSCMVDTWAEDNIEVPIENLESMGFNKREYKNLEDIGVRMTKLHQTGSLDEAALWVLNGLSKLDRSYLTPLEEKLLQVLEAFYVQN
ncbi:hypothetical protein [Myxosarcina sp. GI1]|uniref:hypothetical protein n=1 Tax=Myxosarcina sp. GI1 TaxID=1541065 RepID=UPI0006909AC8|nr:hypothetical protein [Myxosarcina sp. GI1]